MGVGGCGLDYTCVVENGQQLVCLEAQARIAIETGDKLLPRSSSILPPPTPRVEILVEAARFSLPPPSHQSID